MKAGTYISGAGHIGLIGWVLFGGLFQPSEAARVPEDISVSIVTSEELAALSSPSPSEETAPEAPQPPVEEAAPEAPAPEPQVETPEPPAVEPPPDPDQAPTPVEAIAEAEVGETAPETLPAPDIETAAVIVSPEPQPRPATRVAPTPAAQPPDEVEIDEAIREEVAPDPNAAPETPKEESDATAPEEAAPEIVTEAEVPSAPTKSIRPKTRPTRRASAPKTETPKADPLADAIAGAVAEANETETAAASEPAVPKGPPLTGGEKDGLRVSVQRCWNVGSLSSDALNTTVVVSVTMTREGKPDTGSIQMLSFSGGSRGAAGQAFEAARRAIIRCGAKGYNLPIEKFGQWQNIEMTFNPERMRIK